MDSKNITAGEHTTLVLSLNGPSRARLEWHKESITLTDAIDFDRPLFLNTADVSNPYGEYCCSASNGFFPSEEIVLISEKGKIMVVSYFAHAITSLYVYPLQSISFIF